MDNPVFNPNNPSPTITGELEGSNVRTFLANVFSYMCLSLVISGLTDEVDQMLREEGIIRHSIEHSLGILGQKERMPTLQILELTTMCGHGMIAA